MTPLPLRAPVIVTRPAEAGRRLTARLVAAGFDVRWWPAFEIAPAPDEDAVRSRLSALADVPLVLLVSPAAVAACAALLPNWPVGVAIAAVGAGTAEAARAAFGPAVEVVEPPPEAIESGSEALWQVLVERGLPHKVLIARAEHGREWLSQQLAAAGVEVERLAVYRRLPLALSDAEREQLAHSLSDLPPQILVTSSEAVDVLVEALAGVPGALEWAQRGRCLVIHSRIRQRLLEAGFADVDFVAAEDEAVIAKLESAPSSAL